MIAMESILIIHHNHHMFQNRIYLAFSIWGFRSNLTICDSTDLVAVQSPVLQLLLKQRPAHISGVVQLARPVVVEDLTEHPRMPGNEKINRLHTNIATVILRPFIARYPPVFMRYREIKMLSKAS